MEAEEVASEWAESLDPAEEVDEWRRREALVAEGGAAGAGWVAAESSEQASERGATGIVAEEDVKHGKAYSESEAATRKRHLSASTPDSRRQCSPTCSWPMSTTAAPPETTATPPRCRRRLAGSRPRLHQRDSVNE